jgi:hypothetical protein
VREVAPASGRIDEDWARTLGESTIAPKARAVVDPRAVIFFMAEK